MIDSNQLRHLQLCELEIAKEIKRICDAHSIRYFLVAGSLLGAIRHKGFIPWDDDMDFGMERPEYEKFCSVCKKELRKEFFLQTWDTDPKYPFSYGKMRLIGTSVVEAFAPEKTEHDGIFVDIFPLDNAPDNEIEMHKHARRIFFLRRVLWMKCGYGKNMRKDSMKKRIKYNISRLAFSFVPYVLTKDMFINTLSRYGGVQITL